MKSSIAHAPSTKAAALLAATLAAFASQAFAFGNFTVGSDAACDYTSIQAAVDAAAAAGLPPNYVSIATNSTYDNQAITIDGQQGLYITGGLSDCTQTTPSGQTLLSGTTGHSVFSITGAATVQLIDLDIANGRVGSDFGGGFDGGGIYFGGSGSLTLVHTSVHDNDAGFGGGGIAMDTTGASVLALQDSSVHDNFATSYGGGILIGANTIFYADSGTHVTSNTTHGWGGGIYLDASTGTAAAFIAATVDRNEANVAGGGIFAVNGAKLNLFSSDAASPVSIYGNTAGDSVGTGGNGGGGIYLGSDFGAYNGLTTLCAQDFSIDANTAHDGAAIETIGGNTQVYINVPGISCAPTSPPIAMSPVACAVGPSCDEISDNVAQATDGTPTNGSAIAIDSDGTGTGFFFADRIAARRNHGTDVIYLDAVASGAKVLLEDCLIADNVETGYDIYAHNEVDGTEIALDSCTFSGNSEGGGYMIVAPRALALTNSILYESGGAWAAYIPSAATTTIEYDLAGPNNDETNQGMLTGTGVTTGTPMFVDAAGGNYHLKPASPGVDYSGLLYFGGSAVDLDGNPRSIDLSDVPNQYGPMDLGAYEVQTDAACATSDTVFCDGFDG